MSNTSKNGRTRAPIGTEVPRVPFGDWAAVRSALESEGYCVVQGVASTDEVNHAKELFWQWIESIGLGFNRNDPATLRNEAWRQIGYAATGVVMKYGIGQSEFLWYCRTLPRMLEMWRALWGTDELVTSFDGTGVIRNPALAPVDEDWVTRTGWYHLDQNAMNDPEFLLWQGLLNLEDTDASTGSTVVVPRSHHRFHEVFEGASRSRKNIVMLNDRQDYDRFCSDAIQVNLSAGDFLLWDSRVIHCNQGADLSAGRREDKLIVRHVAYVCFIPKEQFYARGGNPRDRRAAVRDGSTGTHDPVAEILEIRDVAPPSYEAHKESSPIWAYVS